MTMRRTLTACPVCTEPLEVSELACQCCKTQIRGTFERCGFCALGHEQAQFVALFLQHRGNLTALAAELNLSPPTVARRLDAVLATLGVRDVELAQLRKPDQREGERR